MKKKTISAILFLFLTVGTIAVFNRLTYIKETNNASFYFWSERENTIDVLILGSSQVYCGIDPAVFWKENGITAYDLSTSLQLPWGTYSLLKAALNTQRPRVVVVDVFFFTSLLSEQDPEEAAFFNHRVYDPIPPSFQKISDILQIPEITNKKELLFPLLLNHSRAVNGSLGAQDFDYAVSPPRHPAKGYEIVLREKAVEPERIEAKGTEPIPEIAEKYLRKIIAICKKEGISLILTRTPGINTAQLIRQYHEIDRIASENGVTFINFNDLISEIQLDYENDFNDANGVASHLNASGAEKTSRYLSHFLSDTYSLPDHRGDDAFNDWARSSAYTDNYRSLAQENDFSLYIERVCASGMTAVVMLYRLAGESLPKTVLAEFQSLETDFDLSVNADIRWAGVIQEGRLVSEEMRKNKDLNISFYDGDFLIKAFVSDSKEEESNFGKISVEAVFDGFSGKAYDFVYPLSVFVFDPIKGSMVDAVSFDLYKTGKAVRAEGISAVPQNNN